MHGKGGGGGGDRGTGMHKFVQFVHQMERDYILHSTVIFILQQCHN